MKTITCRISNAYYFRLKLDRMRDVKYDICESIVTRILIETPCRLEGQAERKRHRVTHVRKNTERGKSMRVARVTGADGVGLRKGMRAKRRERGNNKCHSTSRTADI